MDGATLSEIWPIVCVLYLYQHNVIVLGGFVVARVRNQKLGHDFLLCALIDGQRVVPCHYHHVFYPAEIKKYFSQSR